MRPLHLLIQGFMAYKQPVEIDFSSMNVFALTGPTGSGKSSILDAMCFALYGETPRIGPKDIKKLIYHDVEDPHTQAMVSFAFRYLGQDYRITRQLGSNHRVELDKRGADGQTWKTHSTGSVNHFKTFIPELLGLDFKAFSRVLLLPQGGFDQFLKQDGPDYRRKVLVSLAQLDIYDKIQQAADQHRKQLQPELIRLEGRLSGIGDVSPALLEQTQTTLMLQKQTLATQIDTYQQAKQLQNETEELWKLLQALNKNQTEQSLLDQQQSNIEQLQQQLQQGRQLLQLAPDIKHLQQGQVKQAQLEQLEQTVLQKQSQLKLREEPLAQQHKLLEQKRADKATWDNHIAQLQDLKPLVEHGKRLQEQEHTSQKKMTEHQQTIHAIQIQQQKTEATLALDLQQMTALQEKMKLLICQPERLELLQDIQPELKQLQVTEQPGLQLLQERSQKLMAQQQEQTLIQQQLLQKSAQQEQECRQREAEREQAEAKWAEIQLHQQSRVLQAHLQVGKECPVCHQSIHQLPQLEIDENLEQAKTLVQIVKNSLKEAEQQLLTLKQQERDTIARLEQIKEQQQETSVALQKQTETISALEEALLSHLGVSMLPTWEQVLQEIQTLRTAQKERELLEEQQRRYQTQQQKYQQDIEQFQKEHAFYEKELALCEAPLKEVQQELNTLKQTLETALGVTTGFTQELETRLKGLQNRLDELTEQERLLQIESQALKEEQIKLESEFQFIQKSVVELRVENELQHQAVSTSLAALGYESIVVAQTALQPETKLLQWEKQIQEHVTQTQTLLRERVKLQEHIAGRSLTEEHLLEVKNQVIDLQRQIDTLTGEVAISEKQLENIQAILKQTEELQTQRSSLKQQLDVYERIHQDLGSKNLPDFLAKRIMERVIASGSDELNSLSNERYRFDLDESEELVILDAWNANEPRSVKTLSGGESFLASLALALALNTYLSAGIQLDSLFIDEGFGSLDPETLEMATEVLEKLQVGGKCIGVITHIAELAERFETRIQVVKSENGSRVVVS